MVQQVLDLPKPKISKPSDTCWLPDARCVKAVRDSYGAIITAQNNIHENTHEPEALGLCKALTKHHAVAAMCVLDYVLLQAANLSRPLQTEQFK